MSVSDLRHKLKQTRHQLSTEERELKSTAITHQLMKYLPIRRAQKIAAYMATADEVDTTDTMNFLSGIEKSLFLPVVNHQKWRKAPLLFEAYIPDVTPLKKNRYGIDEPIHHIGQCVLGTDMDIVLVPLVGFNENLDRIGMGGGYYDRAFAKRQFRKTKLVGLAFDCQKADFEAMPHDVPLDALITESGILEPH